MKSNKWIGLLFISGLIILIFPYLVRYYYENQNVKSFEEFMEESVEMTDEQVEDLLREVAVCNQKLYDEVTGIIDPFLTNQKKLEKMKECLGIQNDEVFAVLEIPVLELVIPIYLSATDEILAKGIGHVEGSSLPVGGQGSHTVLAGHRGQWTQQMFKFLDKVQPEDYFYIHTLSETLTYRVFDQSVIYPDETDSLEVQEGKDLATLITCHPFGSNVQRLLIRAERVDNKEE